MTEAQALSAWAPPGGTLGELTDEALARAATLRSHADELARRATDAPVAPSLARALRSESVAIIAEVKRSSPSKGVINREINVTAQLEAYERGGAAAVSILTEPSRFLGSNQDLIEARTTAKVPLLKKDFHVDVLQLLEARALGASAALVIARALNASKMRTMLDAARECGLEVLVEVRTEAELDLALSLGAELVGVNNRNLETLQIDPETSARIIPLIPRSVLAIAESGVNSADDIRKLAAIGADAVLVGSSISASSDPEAAVRALTGIPRTTGARQS